MKMLQFMKHPIFLVRVPKVLLKTVIQGDKIKKSSKNLPKKSMYANKKFLLNTAILKKNYAAEKIIL